MIATFSVDWAQAGATVLSIVIGLVVGSASFVWMLRVRQEVTQRVLDERKVAHDHEHQQLKEAHDHEHQLLGDRCEDRCSRLERMNSELFKIHRESDAKLNRICGKLGIDLPGQSN